MDIFGKKPNVEKIRVNKDVEGLIRTLKYEDKDVRREAAEALVKIGEPAVEPLIEALKDGDWHARGRAAVALGNIGDERAVEPLLRVLNDTHNNAAATALEKIGFNFSDSPPSGVDLIPTRQSGEVIQYVSRQYPELYSALIDIGISGCEVSYEKMLSMTQSYSNLSYGHVGKDPGVYFKIPNTKCPECRKMVDINCGITVVGHLAPLVKKHIYFELHCPICNESGSNSYSL